MENDYAGGDAQDPTDGLDFVARRAAAYQAYYEHQPIRVDPPSGDSLELYRLLDWGGLARFYVLDGRQYRDDQPCTGEIAPDCPDRAVDTATILGQEQEDWLAEGFGSSKATWNVLANQVIFTPLPLGGSIYNMDQWDGYPAARNRLLDQMTAADLANPVVITGDVHASGVGDVSTGEPGAPVLATEFVGTSISSTFPPELIDAAAALIGGLPQVKWFNARERGYVVCDLTPDTFKATYRVVSSIAEPGADISTVTTWRVQAGTPGAIEA
ncbi:MAG: alkaline phosphatase D family protein [Acidimicrobiales bacterium]